MVIAIFIFTEIKRFINQDILTGSITNSKSLNRYSYVEGNPISLTDPFGLSPAMCPWRFAHGVLGLAGCVTGPVAIVANLFDSIIYAAVDHNYTMMFMSLLSAVSLGAGSIAKTVRTGTGILSYAPEVLTIVSNTASFAKNTISGVSTFSFMYNKYVKEGNKISGATAIETLTFVLNVAGAGLAAKNVYDSIATIRVKSIVRKVVLSEAYQGGTNTVNPNALKYNGDGTWTSNSGLIYGQGSKEGNRVLHVLEHTKPNPNKPVHTVFNVDKYNVIGLVDEAWNSRGVGNLASNGYVTYNIDMGKKIGTNGETFMRIVTNGYTNKLISAYPIP